MKSLFFAITLFSAIFFFACNSIENKLSNPQELDSVLGLQGVIHHNQEFKDYWYAGDAEISTYKLNQARYGELRKGTASLIYVTEPFLKDSQVKADNHREDNIPVLKLNATKKFSTGIYPYSIMTSIFSPTDLRQQVTKISFSAQEWCGHSYAQINNRDGFLMKSHSYFANQGDEDIKLAETLSEDAIWTTIRLSPENLPTGDHEMIPSLEYVRLHHKEMKAYGVKLDIKNQNDTAQYSISYPELNRTLKISYSQKPPYKIYGWSESIPNGKNQSKLITSTAYLMHSMKIDYWNKNSLRDTVLREELGL